MTDDLWRNVMNAYYVSSTEMVAAECWLSVSARIRILRVSLENLDIYSLLVSNHWRVPEQHVLRSFIVF